MCIPNMVQEILGIFPTGALGLSAELTFVALHLTGTACSTISLLHGWDHATLGELHVASVIPVISRLSSQLEVLSYDNVWKHDGYARDHVFLCPIPPT